MMRPGTAALTLAATLSAAAAVELDRPRRAVEIISVDTLRIELETRAVLDTRSKETYLEGHVPPAFPADGEKLAAAVLASAEPDPTRVLAALERAPLSRHHPVVVYGGSDPARSDGWVAWLLAYSGVPQVDILDGGFPAWNRRRKFGVFMGYPMPSGARTLEAKDMTPRLNLRVDPSMLDSAREEGGILLEARAGSPDTAQQGSVVHVSEVLDAQGHFLYPYHLRALLEDKRIRPDARLLVQGEPAAAGFIWAALASNGFEAAIVMAAGPSQESDTAR